MEFPIGAFGCLQTNTALPQLRNISRVSAETSRRKAQCIFALLCTAKNMISKHRKILKIIRCVCLTSKLYDESIIVILGGE